MIDTSVWSDRYDKSFLFYNFGLDIFWFALNLEKPYTALSCSAVGRHAFSIPRIWHASAFCPISVSLLSALCPPHAFFLAAISDALGLPTLPPPRRSAATRGTRGGRRRELETEVVGLGQLPAHRQAFLRCAAPRRCPAPARAGSQGCRGATPRVTREMSPHAAGPDRPNGDLIYISDICKCF